MSRPIKEHIGGRRHHLTLSNFHYPIVIDRVPSIVHIAYERKIVSTRRAAHVINHGVELVGDRGAIPGGATTYGRSSSATTAPAIRRHIEVVKRKCDDVSEFVSVARHIEPEPFEADDKNGRQAPDGNAAAGVSETIALIASPAIIVVESFGLDEMSQRLL